MPERTTHVVMALDPGITTGIAVGRITNERIVCIESSQGALNTFQVFGLLESVVPSYLVAEGFEYRNDSRPGLELFSRNILGVCEMWATLRGSAFRTPTAARGKAWFGDEKLRKLGYYEPGKPHARDALRHLFTFLEFGKGSLLWDGSFVEQLAQELQ